MPNLIAQQDRKRFKDSGKAHPHIRLKVYLEYILMYLIIMIIPGKRTESLADALQQVGYQVWVVSDFKWEITSLENNCVGCLRGGNGR
jgi:hypothetical protein